MKSRKYFWQIFAALFGLSACSALALYFVASADTALLRGLLISLPIQIVLAVLLALRLERSVDILRSLLSSMAEGVIAVDSDMRITQLNEAAGTIFQLDPKAAVGRSVRDVIHDASIIELIEDVRRHNKTAEKDIEQGGERPQHLHVQAGPMDSDSRAVGVVAVFTDVTRMRELEGMRRNFVSNVSHELRTPLTSIQGFAETLLNPAVKDPDEVRKFLQIIQRHAARLGRIIEDILTLSSIERDADSDQIELKTDPIHPVLASAVEICEPRAAVKKIKIELECATDLVAPIDPHLLEQAIINLIDNAIRYSDEGRPIRVEAAPAANEIHIHVIDQGIGIPEKQLPRIFERFYRVDKARSRELGGTGLGLSIVKHISLAHKGSVEVQSQLGRGSRFTIRLPGSNFTDK